VTEGDSGKKQRLGIEQVWWNVADMLQRTAGVPDNFSLASLEEKGTNVRLIAHPPIQMLIFVKSWFIGETQSSAGSS
jgi:hypothetical protein